MLTTTTRVIQYLPVKKGNVSMIRKYHNHKLQTNPWHLEEERHKYTRHQDRVFPAILGKGPGQNWEKMIDLTSKLGENNDIEHSKGSKRYPQTQVILDCIVPSIPLKHKCLSFILIWISVSHK